MSIKNSIGNAFDSSRNSINIIRALAALCVIYGHSQAITGHGPEDVFLKFIGYKFIGGVAVDVFFLLSGFLITASALNGKGLHYFIFSRILRIYPALIVCVLCTVFMIGPFLSIDGGYLSASQTYRYLWINATAYSTEYFLPGVFSSLHQQAVNGSLWSLPVEVRLYFFVAVLYFIGIYSQKYFFNCIFFFLMAVGFFYRDLYFPLLGPENHIHVAMMFLVGSFIWVNRLDIPIDPSILFVLLVFAASQRGLPGFAYSYALLLPYLVFYVAMGKWGTWFNSIGDFSYGIYLYGWLCQQLVMQSFPDISNTTLTLVSSMYAILCGAISWYLIEKPALALKRLLCAN